MNDITASGQYTSAHADGKNCLLLVALRACALLAFAVFVIPSAFAQQRPSTKESERAQRAKAVELIIETANAARTFKDLYYRARVQTLAADTLWPQDEQRARDIFRRAWEAATAYDKSEQETEERESGVPSTIPITDARDEVLVTVAARDALLAESFLRDLLAEKKDEEKPAAQTQAPARRRTPWREVSEAGLRRLALAYELLNRNEPSRAAHIASPVTNEGTSAELLTFILRLREQSVEYADAVYSRLLDQVRVDTRSDANDVLLLSSPIVSPQLLVVVDDQGAFQFRPVPRSSPNAHNLPPVAALLRQSFFDIAANVLLRPVVPRNGQNSNPDAIARYFAIGRLLPFFMREAPAYVANLRMQGSTLANEIEAGRREALNSQFELTSLTPERAGDPLRAQIDQLGRARDARDRDRIALGIVKKATRGRLWDRARRAAADIEEVNLRRSALSFIAVNQIADLLRAFSEDKEANFDRLAKFVRNADVPALGVAWGLAQVATIAASKGDKQSATALLDEAQAYAARTPAGTWQRVAGYTAIARIAVSIDLKRAWELLPEIVRAANAVEELNGDESTFEIEVAVNNTGEAMETLSLEADVFRLDSIFATMARLDGDKAIAEARSIGKETPRAFAMLAIAKEILKAGHRTQDSE